MQAHDPSPTPSAGPGPAASTSPGRKMRPLQSLLRHGHVGLLAALLLLLVGAPLVWVKGQSTYVAEAVFQVSPNYQKNLSADKELEFQSNSQYREFVNHLSRSVVRYDVVERAIEQLSGRGCMPAETRRKCVERLQRVIYVLPVPDTYMVRVGLQTGQQGEADQIINKVMQIFLDTVRDEQIFGSGDRADVLKKQTGALRAEVVDLEKRRAELAGKLGLTTFTEITNNPYDTTLSRAREQFAQTNLERSAAQATLKAFEAMREVPLQGGRSVLEMRLQDNGLQALRNEVVKRSEELARSVAGLEPSHPGVAPALREKAEIAARLQARENEFEKHALMNVRARLTGSFQQAQQVEREAQERLAVIEARATEFAVNFRAAMRLTGEMNKREQELNDIRTRLNFIRTESPAIGFARLITPALPAITPLGLGRVKMGLGLVLLCLFVFVALPVMVDLTDRRVLVVADAEKALGIPSAAWFVDKTNQSSALLSDDQYLRFSSTLLRNRGRGAESVFAFTSARVGGGCTAVVTQLSRRLQGLGARVLVVDANTLAAHSPLHHIGVGLTDHLAGKARLADIVVRDSLVLPGIDLVPIGTLRSGGLKDVERLKAAVRQWQSEYDLVLMDIPPLLPSADAELLVDVARQVFLVVEAGSVTKAELVQVRGLLAKQAPEAVGLVVNKVSLDPGNETQQQHMLESITGGRFNQFMSTPGLRLQFDLLQIRLQRALRWARVHLREWNHKSRYGPTSVVT